MSRSKQRLSALQNARMRDRRRIEHLSFVGPSWDPCACRYKGMHTSFASDPAQRLEPNSPPSHQKWTNVRRPRTQALSVLMPAPLYPRPPGLMTYWASNLRFSQPVACQPYQASIGTSLPPAFGPKAAEFTWVVPTAKATSSSGRQENVPVCLIPQDIW